VELDPDAVPEAVPVVGGELDFVAEVDDAPLVDVVEGGV
jgi:hypothetical protein